MCLHCLCMCLHCLCLAAASKKQWGRNAERSRGCTRMASYRLHIGFISASYRPHIRIISASYWHHIGLISASYWHQIGLILASYWHHAGSMLLVLIFLLKRLFKIFTLFWSGFLFINLWCLYKYDKILVSPCKTIQLIFIQFSTLKKSPWGKILVPLGVSFLGVLGSNAPNFLQRCAYYPAIAVTANNLKFLQMTKGVFYQWYSPVERPCLARAVLQSAL